MKVYSPSEGLGSMWHAPGKYIAPLGLFSACGKVVLSIPSAKAYRATTASVCGNCKKIIRSNHP